jgi:hypothetical protein
MTEGLTKEKTRLGPDEGSAQRSLKKMESIQGRAGYWNALADRLEQAGSWG